MKYFIINRVENTICHNRDINIYISLLFTNNYSSQNIFCEFTLPKYFFSTTYYYKSKIIYINNHLQYLKNKTTITEIFYQFIYYYIY